MMVESIYLSTGGTTGRDHGKPLKQYFGLELRAGFRQVDRPDKRDGLSINTDLTVGGINHRLTAGKDGGGGNPAGSKDDLRCLFDDLRCLFKSHAFEIGRLRLTRKGIEMGTSDQKSGKGE